MGSEVIDDELAMDRGAVPVAEVIRGRGCRRAALLPSMPLEPLDVVEVLVAPRGSLVPEQRLPANDRYDAAVDVGKKRRAGGFVEGHSADLGQHFDAQRLQADTTSRAFARGRPCTAIAQPPIRTKSARSSASATRTSRKSSGSSSFDMFGKVDLSRK
jgi:hypothetical protein